MPFIRGRHAAITRDIYAHAWAIDASMYDEKSLQADFISYEGETPIIARAVAAAVKHLPPRDDIAAIAA